MLSDSAMWNVEKAKLSRQWKKKKKEEEEEEEEGSSFQELGEKDV